MGTRSYATIQVSIWDNEDFLALSPAAKCAYFMLVTQGNIEACGSLELTLRRWSGYVAGGDTTALVGWLNELAEARFVLIDKQTEELLVRTFARYDGGYLHPTRRKAVMHSAGSIRSVSLRSTCAEELGLLGVHLDPAATTGGGAAALQRGARQGARNKLTARVDEGPASSPRSGTQVAPESLSSATQVALESHSSGTGVPVESHSSGTGERPESLSSGSPVPVESLSSGTEVAPESHRSVKNVLNPSTPLTHSTLQGAVAPPLETAQRQTPADPPPDPGPVDGPPSTTPWCPRHPGGTDHACTACKRARVTHDAAVDAATAQAREADRARRHDAIQIRAAAIAACTWCDHTGYRPTGPACNHQPPPDPNARARAFADITLPAREEATTP